MCVENAIYISEVPICSNITYESFRTTLCMCLIASWEWKDHNLYRVLQLSAVPYSLRNFQTHKNYDIQGMKLKTKSHS